MNEDEKLLLVDAGRKARDLVVPGSDWVHRRVQRVSYLEPALVKVGVSIDFTVPHAALGSHLPISVLPKWPPLYRFDYRRDDGTPLPLLTTEQNGFADEALLRSLVEMVSPASLVDPKFERALKTLALGTETDLNPTVDAFEEGMHHAPGDPLGERILDIAAVLAEATVLWFPTAPAEAGQRTIVKIEYLIRNPEPRWHIRLLRSLSWYQGAEYIPLMHVGADANFHAEVEAPPVLTIRSVEPRYYWLAEADDDEASDEAADRADSEAEEAELRPQQNTEKEGRLAHVYIAGRRPLGVDLVVAFAPSRFGVVLSAFFASLLVAALASAFYYWRDQAALSANIDAAVAVLILIPALIGYVVIRPADHPLAHRYVFGTQVLSLLASGIPLGMAVLLLRFAGDPADLKTAWLWSMRGSWLLAALLAFSWARTWFGSTTSDSDD